MTAYIKPFRACDADIRFVRFPLIAMPKIDGVRGVQFGPDFTARTLKRFKNRHLTALLSHPILRGLDGELTALQNVTDPALCRTTTSVVNTIVGVPRIWWWLFDYVTQETWHKPYIKRLEMLEQRVILIRNQDLGYREILSVVPWKLVHNAEELDQEIALHLEMGFEGTIGRDPNATHKEGYCTAREANFIRFKQFKDAEATIIGFEPVQENLNPAMTNELGLTYRTSHKENKLDKDQIGVFLCQMADGTIVRVSAGSIPHEQKTYLFYNFEEIRGQILTFKYFPKGIKDKPRFPVVKIDKGIHILKNFRSVEDL